MFRQPVRAKRMIRLLCIAGSLIWAGVGEATEGSARGPGSGSLPGTAAFTEDASVGALAERVLDDWHAFFLRRTELARQLRRDPGPSEQACEAPDLQSAAASRQRLAEILGVVETRLPIQALDYLGTTAEPALLEENDLLAIYRVQWTVVAGLQGEGLLLEPRREGLPIEPRARLVLLPDADQLPEELAGLTRDSAEGAPARQLAAAGCQVIVPVLIDRQDHASGSERLDRWTNQPHREWIYRQAFQAGRHIIGYEIQQVLAAIDWFRTLGDEPVGVLGYGEGGLLAFYSAALDPRIAAVLVSGHFGPREDLWQEPIYRNVWNLLSQFGDAEVAGLIAPRTLVVEPSEAPPIDGPPEPRAGRTGAAPGRIATPAREQVLAEIEHARQRVGSELADQLHVVSAAAGAEPWSDEALALFLKAVGIEEPLPPAPPRGEDALEIDGEARQLRRVRQLERYTQRLIRDSENERGRTFWQPLEAKARQHTPEEIRAHWHEWTQPHRIRLGEQVLGRLEVPGMPFNVRTRQLEQSDDWTIHLVVFDLWEDQDVISWGYLIVPAGMGDRVLPAVVCQHGLGSTPATTIDPDSAGYSAYATRLAELGFVVYSPYNPNVIPGDRRFRQLQRVANPLGLSIFSAITAQHEVTLNWLGSLPYVDAERIGFYGLSYGGKTAMRVGALLEGFAAVICSGDYNEWVRKVTSVEAWPHADAPSDRFTGYPFTREYEIFEYNLAHTFNYAEMSALIAPRAFMVERGHHDRVASDEWAAFEYAKVRRLYNTVLQQPERTTIEYFDGGHRIHGVGAFEFLQRHLQGASDPQQP